ncbi:MAG: fibronectin type III domain-containing protein [Candidatus Omnitrophica bacterium]|nr:fibronectin type III domain-containing protein [Candidatus Omnitrophota bacterium]
MRIIRLALIFFFLTSIVQTSLAFEIEKILKDLGDTDIIQATTDVFQLKKSTIVSGAGNTYRLDTYNLTAIIGEAIGGQSSNSANYALSSGYMSDPQTIPGFDSTPPTTPVVIDDGDYTTSSSTLHASWSAEDPESEIAQYLYSVPGIVDWTSAGLDTEITLTSLGLKHGQTYYFEVIAKNNAGISSEVGMSDGITVNLSEPIILILIPENLSKVYAEDQLDIQVAASDSDGDTLEYQIIIDGEIKQDWSHSRIFSWTINAEEAGKVHIITANVRDGNGAVVSKQSKVFILHKPINPPLRPISNSGEGS